MNGICWETSDNLILLLASLWLGRASQKRYNYENTIERSLITKRFVELTLATWCVFVFLDAFDRFGVPPSAIRRSATTRGARMAAPSFLTHRTVVTFFQNHDLFRQRDKLLQRVIAWVIGTRTQSLLPPRTGFFIYWSPPPRTDFFHLLIAITILQRIAGLRPSG